MINSIGLQGPGIEAFVEDSLPRLAQLGVPVWVSVGGFAASDYARCCAALDGDDRVAAIELNLSCPNVEEAPETAAELVAAARAATSTPLYAKLSPAQWDIAASARKVVAAGADGLSLVNTIRGLAFDPRPCGRGSARCRRVLGTGTQADRARVRPRLRSGGRRADRGDGRRLVGTRRARAPRGRSERGRARDGALRRPGCTRPDPARARGGTRRPGDRTGSDPCAETVVALEKYLQRGENGTA